MRASQFIHDQAQPATVWTVDHNLLGFPSVTTVNASGTKIRGTVNYVDNKKVVITFTEALVGKVYLS